MVNGHSRNNYAQSFSIVVRGRLPPPAVQPQGWFEAPGAHHIVCGNARTTEPAKFLVVFIANDKEELVTMDK